jgi:lipoate-protein ligase B
MTEAQAKFVELEKRKAAVKQYFEDLENAAIAVAKEIGVNGYFQDVEGTVYKIVLPEGRFVKFDKIGYVRTRRSGEKRGDLSLTEAQEAGYQVS